MIGEFLNFWGISFGFPFFDFQPLKAWHPLHLRTERYMTKPSGATLSCMRPLVGIFNLEIPMSPVKSKRQLTPPPPNLDPITIDPHKNETLKIA